MGTDLSTQEGRKSFINDNLSDLLSGINDTYGPILLDELLKRIEYTINEFNSEIVNAFSQLKEKDKQRKEFFSDINANDDKESDSKTEWEKKLESIESKK